MWWKSIVIYREIGLRFDESGLGNREDRVEIFWVVFEGNFNVIIKKNFWIFCESDLLLWCNIFIWIIVIRFIWFSVWGIWGICGKLVEGRNGVGWVEF